MASGEVKNIEDSSSSYRILTDEFAKDAPIFREYSDKLANIVLNSKPQFTVGIYGGWGTGKTTLMQMIRKKLEESAHKEDIIVVWFDAWWYENEKYSAVIPLIRTIKIAVDNKIVDEMRHTGLASAGLTRLRKGVTNVLGGVAKSATLNANFLGTGVSLDVEKLTENLASEGSVEINGEKIYLRKQHIRNYLEDCVGYFLNERKLTRRIVIFIDDLDRCTPQKAMEILESIKTFFDIEGIIYIIGMDPNSIDSIISVKYGKGSNVNGLEYLQKIVQLPFSIPVWSRHDLIDTIKGMTETIGLSESTRTMILDQKNTRLILKSAELNPRNIKRFINSIAFSLFIYGESIIVESLISIQAFYFRGVDTKLFRTNLSNSIIIKAKNYRSIKLDQATTFENAVIDDVGFIDYITESTGIMNVRKLNNKKELRMELEKRELDDERILYLLDISTLPE